MASKLNFKILGQGNPVIILHGLFGMLDNWLDLAKRLEAKDYMSYLIDQRDHGRSAHSNNFSYSLMANDLYEFMHENWIHSSILIGHSMGGKTGLQFASEHEEMISKLIVIDMGMKKYELGHQDVFEALFSINLDFITTRNQVEVILMEKLCDKGTVQFLMKNLTRKKEGGFEWKMNLPLLYKDYSNIINEIIFEAPCQVKTLFIRGSESDYILDDDIPKMRRIFPNSQFVTIQNAGHWIHVDKPNELFKEIITFIRD